MKRTTVCILTLATVMLFQTPRVSSQENTVIPTASDAQLKQIENLKDRLATKVAELRQTQRRAIAGTVKKVDVSTLTIETETKDIKIDLPEEIAVIQYLKGVRTILSIQDVSPKDLVVVFGEHDSTLDILIPKIIHIMSIPPEMYDGTVTEIDLKAFTITVTTPQDRTLLVDIEKTTKTNVWTRADGVVKGGFSNIAAGDSVHIIGIPVPKKENRVSAIRILNLGNLFDPSPTLTPTLLPPSESPTPTE